MKTLIALLIACTFSHNTFAMDLTPQPTKTYYGFYNLAPFKVTTAPLCPDNMVCVLDGTQVTLHYMIPCDDELVALDYKLQEKDGIMKIFVSTSAGHLTPAGQATCAAMSVETKNIILVDFYGEVKVLDLGVIPDDVRHLQPIEQDLTVVKPVIM